MTEQDKKYVIEALEYALHKCIDADGDTETHYNTLANAIEVLKNCSIPVVNRFYRVDKYSDRKLRYNGFCLKCNKNTDHRVHGATISKHLFRCMKCKTINEGVYA